MLRGCRAGIPLADKKFSDLIESLCFKFSLGGLQILDGKPFLLQVDSFFAFKEVVKHLYSEET